MGVSLRSTFACLSTLSVFSNCSSTCKCGTSWTLRPCGLRKLSFSMVCPRRRKRTSLSEVFSLKGVARRFGEVRLASFLGNHSAVGRPITGTNRDDTGELFPVRVTPSFTIGVLRRVAGLSITDSRTIPQVVDKPPSVTREDQELMLSCDPHIMRPMGTC